MVFAMNGHRAQDFASDLWGTPCRPLRSKKCIFVEKKVWQKIILSVGTALGEPQSSAPLPSTRRAAIDVWSYPDSQPLRHLRSPRGTESDAACFRIAPVCEFFLMRDTGLDRDAATAQPFPPVNGDGWVWVPITGSRCISGAETGICMQRSQALRVQ